MYVLAAVDILVVVVVVIIDTAVVVLVACVLAKTVHSGGVEEASYFSINVLSSS